MFVLCVVVILGCRNPLAVSESSNLAFGEVVPIPTLPFPNIVILVDTDCNPVPLVVVVDVLKLIVDVPVPLPTPL